MSFTSQSIISVRGLTKTYSSGLEALKRVDLDIPKGEIFALLGANGAGKTTFIGCVCGTIQPSNGEILVGGHNVLTDYRQARKMIGLVPQELTTDAFETVWNTVSFSRGLFGCSPDPVYIEAVLKGLSLWEKRSQKLLALSGGMKRRVLIAKALSHQPSVLFLDEPTAGVDVELRKSMWEQMSRLREAGTTIILTTHYIEEAEEMADRVGVMRQGELVLVEKKETLMKKLGFKEIIFELIEPLSEVPMLLHSARLALRNQGKELVYTYGSQRQDDDIQSLLTQLQQNGVRFRDMRTDQSSLEDIFVTLANP